MPNRWHPDPSSQAGSVQFVDAAGNFTGQAVGTAGSLRLVSGTMLIILPTADPHVTGALWNNSGTITVSSG